jgi:hypothetical protein
MKSASIDMQSLERILNADAAGSAGDPESMLEPEHPLAGKLRKVLDNRDTSSVGDLANVVDHLMREMAFMHQK